MQRLDTQAQLKRTSQWCNREDWICPCVSALTEVVNPKGQWGFQHYSQLREFALEVFDAFPYGGIKFYRDESRMVTDKIYVQFGNAPFASGYLYYGCNTNNSGSARTYAVYSPFIVNNKYGERSAEHNMSHSGDIKRALRSAKKDLRRIPWSMVVTRKFREAYPRIQAFHNDVRQTLRTKERDVLGGYIGLDLTNKLHRELVHAVDRGYEFLDPKFGEDMKAIIASKREYEKMTAEYNDEWFFVFVRKNTREEDEVVITKIMVNGPPESWGRSFDADEYAYIAQPEEVPEALQGVMALLQMVEDGHYVENVGMRLSDGNYFACTEKGSVVLG